MASERLRELQEMEKQLQQVSELGEIQPAPRELNLGAGSFRVADGTESSEDERKALVRRYAAAKERERSRLEPWKLWTVIGVTLVSCLILLLVLFSGASPDKYTSSSYNSQPLKASELQKLLEDGSRENDCPDRSWLPEECLDEQRTKSKTALDRCNQFFEHYQYSFELLQRCGVIHSGD